MIRFSCIVFLLMITASLVNAQLLDKNGEEVHPYYISFDAPLPPVVEKVRGEFLHISYQDQIGESETIKFEVHDLKKDSVRRMTLVKQFGQNYFDISLEKQNVSLTEGETYILRLIDEKNNVFERWITYVSKLKHDVTASIMVRPKFIACEDEKGSNLVEFYGEVAGGKAPYKANWYVLNDSRTKFLYQPTQIIVPSPGQTSAIQVDERPEYFVLLLVTDACGNEQTATVQIICEQNEKKVNTLFIQKLDNTVFNKMETPNK